jgi:hypothetical protein
MKNIFGHPWLILLAAVFVFASCDQPQKLSDEEFRESLSEIKQEMQDASALLDSAIIADHSREMISKSNEALNIIETQLDAYMDEMDKAVRRIYKDTRTSIIDMKQKISEIDFRLALLESNEQLKMNEDREGFDDDVRDVRRVRPVGYRFPHIINIDERVIRERIQYGEEVMEEARTNLQELNAELNQFIEENL